MKMPRKLTIANLPTNIEHLKRLSSELGNVDIYLKSVMTKLELRCLEIKSESLNLL